MTTTPDDSDATEKRDWDRHQWVGEGQGEGPENRDPSDTGADRSWKSEEWVGEGQDGGGLPSDKTAEGDSELSGHGHNPGASHWGQGQADNPRDR